ncbi:MAG TPA: hypothetical protein PLP23_15615 [Panacibacter sp.]|nr:hypothetical protein [Panacibacter sp.]
MPGISGNAKNIMLQYKGLIHFAVSTSSAEEVNLLAEQLRNNGFKVIGEPRFTGDGYPGLDRVHK